MRRRHRRMHGLGKLNDKGNCEIHVFRDLMSSKGKGPARKKVCYKRKVSERARAAWASNLKKACSASNLPDSLMAACSRTPSSRMLPAGAKKRRSSRKAK
jgi:hypothetical protein